MFCEEDGDTARGGSWSETPFPLLFWAELMNNRDTDPFPLIGTAFATSSMTRQK